MNKDKLFYLAVPYSGTKEEKEHRYEAVSALCASLIGMGYNVFSPITHSHTLERDFGCFISHSEWMRMDLRYLSHCDGLLVYKMPGWEDSVGVQQEITFAKDKGMPVVYFEYIHGLIEQSTILKLVEG